GPPRPFPAPQPPPRGAQAHGGGSPADALQQPARSRRAAQTSAQAAARKHGLTVAEVEEWRDRFLLGAENALWARPKDEDALKDEQIKKIKQKGGELGLDLHVLEEAGKERPFSPEDGRR